MTEDDKPRQLDAAESDSGEDHPTAADRADRLASARAQLDAQLRGSLGKLDPSSATPSEAKLSMQAEGGSAPEGEATLDALAARLARLEDGQAEILAHLAESAESAEHLRKAVVREIGQLRRDLLDDQRTLATSTVFRAVFPWLKTLRNMQARTPARQRVVRESLASIIDVLRAMLEGLGFQEFQVKVGAPFDPTRMECIGYAEGEAGVVLEMEHPGYLANSALMQPAGVRIAPPGTGQSTG